MGTFRGVIGCYHLLKEYVQNRNENKWKYFMNLRTGNTKIALLWYDAMQFDRFNQRIGGVWCFHLQCKKRISMKAECFSSTWVLTYHNTYWHIPDYSNHHSYGFQNLDYLRTHNVIPFSHVRPDPPRDLLLQDYSCVCKFEVHGYILQNQFHVPNFLPKIQAVIELSESPFLLLQFLCLVCYARQPEQFL
jgi:hypothetical protein